MRRVAAYDRAKRNERVIALGGEQPPHRRRQLPCARNPDDINVVGRRAVPNKRVERAVDELQGHRLVEAAGDNREASPVPRWRPAEFRH